ncbi:MAG: DUF2239 family protein [Thermoleophilia bacterium]|nr:DUF2239 family protein [Thermoleophilia bacterium]
MSAVDQEPTTNEPSYVAFAGQTLVAAGTLEKAAQGAKRAFDEDGNAAVMILDAKTSVPAEVDLRGTPDELAARLGSRRDGRSTQSGAARPATPGRPKLGVVAREVTLLPRHWEWLSRQPGGASVTLRKLVEEARRSTTGEVQKRLAQESCYRFMTIMAGDEPGYEEALRALYAGDIERFDSFTAEWAPDVRDHARLLATAAGPLDTRT